MSILFFIFLLGMQEGKVFLIPDFSFIKRIILGFV